MYLLRSNYFVYSVFFSPFLDPIRVICPFRGTRSILHSDRLDRHFFCGTFRETWKTLERSTIPVTRFEYVSSVPRNCLIKHIRYSVTTRTKPYCKRKSLCDISRSEKEHLIDTNSARVRQERRMGTYVRAQVLLLWLITSPALRLVQIPSTFPV